MIKFYREITTVDNNQTTPCSSHDPGDHTHLHSCKSVPHFLAGYEGGLFIEPRLLFVHTHTKLTVAERFL